VEKMELLVGDVKGKIAILIDDMIDTGHTVRLAAGVLKDAGAKEVYALISHGKLRLCDPSLSSHQVYCPKRLWRTFGICQSRSSSSPTRSTRPRG
jgi:phosphoribosylpyrophosphate synthetase